MDNMTLTEGFAGRFRAERSRLGFTQGSLGERLGVRQQTIYQYEKGNTSPTLNFVYSLQEAGFNLSFLLLGKDRLPVSRDFPVDVLRFVCGMVENIERNFRSSPLSDEAKLKISLMILAKYQEDPNSLQSSAAHPMNLLFEG